MKKETASTAHSLLAMQGTWVVGGRCTEPTLTIRQKMELVYGRINKKLKTTLSRGAIEQMIYKMISETAESDFVKIGKNYYAKNKDKQIRITINSHNYRIITIDKI